MYALLLLLECAEPRLRGRCLRARTRREFIGVGDLLLQLLEAGIDTRQLLGVGVRFVRLFEGEREFGRALALLFHQRGDLPALFAQRLALGGEIVLSALQHRLTLAVHLDALFQVAAILVQSAVALLTLRDITPALSNGAREGDAAFFVGGGFVAGVIEGFLALIARGECGRQGFLGVLPLLPVQRLKCVGKLGAQTRVLGRSFGLSFELAEARRDLSREEFDAIQVVARRGEAPLRFVELLAVEANVGGLFDQAAALLRPER